MCDLNHCRISRDLGMSLRVLSDASSFFIHFPFVRFLHEEPASRLFVWVRLLLVCGERWISGISGSWFQTVLAFKNPNARPCMSVKNIRVREKFRN